MKDKKLDDILEYIKNSNNKDYILNELIKSEIISIDNNYGLNWEHEDEITENKKINNINELNIFKGKEYITHKLIEGNNIDSLNILLNDGMENSIDIVITDPPYNIFIDKKKSKTENNRHLKYNDLLLNENHKFSHSKWISFMYNRLVLIHKLLKEDGVLFISIDDVELYHLKLLLDKIFGEHNFVSNIVWESKSGGGNDSKLINNTNEYILVYAKNIKKLNFTQDKIEHDPQYKYIDEYVETRGKFSYSKLDRSSLRYSNSLDYIIEDNLGNKIIPGGTKEENDKKIWTWRWSKDKVKWGIENGFIVFKPNKNGLMQVYSKQYEFVDNKGNSIERGKPYKSLITHINTRESHKEIKNLFGTKVFPYAKPINLVKYLLNIAGKKEGIILDCFAGSGTTGHAVLELNKEDGGNRQFILCTNNENNICRDITYQRLYKVINGYTDLKNKYIEGIKSNLDYYIVEEDNV